MNVVVKPVLNGLGIGFDQMAYLNVLKWRTIEDKVHQDLYRISLKAHTLDQLSALAPGLIVILGKGLDQALEKVTEFQQKFDDRKIFIPRTNGDRYLKPEGLAAVKMACEKFRAQDGLPKPQAILVARGPGRQPK
jgi:hypothetical protein